MLTNKGDLKGIGIKRICASCKRVKLTSYSGKSLRDQTADTEVTRSGITHQIKKNLSKIISNKSSQNTIEGKESIGKESVRDC